MPGPGLDSRARHPGGPPGGTATALDPGLPADWNLEAPKNYYKGDAGRCLGHCWNLGMRGRTAKGLDVIHLLLEASAWDYQSSKPTYANFESHRLIHSQGGAVFYSHPARWWMGSWGGQGGYPKVDRMRVSNMAVELPLDTLAGPTYDGLDVFTGSNEYAANAKAFQLWSLLLDHGYRLAATASSDACFNRPGGAVPGIVRTYTFVPGRFSLSKVARATAAGKTFATTGPLLVATMDGAPRAASWPPTDKSIFWPSRPGPAAAPRGESPALSCCATGNLSSTPPSTSQPESVRAHFPLQETESAWYCVRVLGSDAQRQVALSGAFYFAAKKLSASPARSGASPRPDRGCSIRPVPPRLPDRSDPRRTRWPGGQTPLLEHRPGTNLRAGHRPPVRRGQRPCPAHTQPVSGFPEYRPNRHRPGRHGPPGLENLRSASRATRQYRVGVPFAQSPKPIGGQGCIVQRSKFWRMVSAVWRTCSEVAARRR